MVGGKHFQSGRKWLINLQQVGTEFDSARRRRWIVGRFAAAAACTCTPLAPAVEPATHARCNLVANWLV